MFEIKMDLEGILVTNIMQSSLLLLTPSEDNEMEFDLKLPIRIGFGDAGAIGLHSTQKEKPRPFTHDLIKDMCEALGARVVKIVIDRVESPVFFASLTLETKDHEEFVLDARPSDAIILSILYHLPLFVTDDVLLQAGISTECSEIQYSESQKVELKDFDKFQEFLNDVDIEDF